MPQSSSFAMNCLKRNIRALLAARGMMQKELADLCGIAPSNLNRILNGNEKVTIERAERIAKAFGISLSELLHENLDKMVAV